MRVHSPRAWLSLIPGARPAADEAGARAGCLERYREKKRRRLFAKTIRYEKRKVNADNRLAHRQCVIPLLARCRYQAGGRAHYSGRSLPSLVITTVAITTYLCRLCIRMSRMQLVPAGRFGKRAAGCCTLD